MKKYKSQIISGFIYVYKQGKYYKIGKSKYEDCRKNKYITENPEQIELVYKYKTNDYTKEEKTIHNLFNEKRINPKREWFLLTENDISLIKKQSV